MGLKYELAISWVSKPSMSHAVTNKKKPKLSLGFFCGSGGGGSEHAHI